MQNKIRQRIEIEKADCEKLMNLIGDKEDEDEMDKDDVEFLSEQIRKFDATHKENMKRIRLLLEHLKKSSDDRSRTIQSMYI